MRAIKSKFTVDLFVYKRLRSRNDVSRIEVDKKIMEKGFLKLKTNSLVCINNAKFQAHCQPNKLISNTNPKRSLTKGLTGKRFIVKHKPWHLPPDRYSLPSDLGKKGGFTSKLARKEETIISHYRRMKEMAEFKFYYKIGLFDKINSKCWYYKGIFTSNPRERKPTIRSMIHDINFSVRSKYLGPATHFPQNYCIGSKKIPKAKPVLIYQYYNNSAVPVKESSLYDKSTYFGSDPTQYNSHLSTACPLIGRCDPDICYRIEISKIKKSRGLPYNKILFNLNVETNFEKHIKGHGHKSRFICSKSCISTITEVVKRSTKELAYLYHPGDYIKMILNPKRNLISFRDENSRLSFIKSFKIKYMATQKPVIRKKLLETPNLAFGSTQSRWKGDTKPKVEKKESERKQKKKQIINIYENIKSKVYDIKPPQNISNDDLKKVVSKLIQYKYSKEPPQKLLLSPNYIGDYGPDPLQSYLQDIKPDVFFKDGEKRSTKLIF